MALNFARPPDGTTSFFMKNSSDTTETMVSMLPPSPSHIFPGVLANLSLLAGSCPVSGLHDFRAVGNARHPFYTVLENPETFAERDNGIDIDHNLHPVEKKRRLTNEQVKSLEATFEVESKLEPERKSHLAQELGLQPRQVAVWFQNRRARYKTKQLEREYDILKQQFDAVCSEKDKLEAEVKRLSDLLDAQEPSTRGAGGKGLRSADQEHETSQVTAQNPPEYHLQQDQEILQAENPTQRQTHYKLSLSVESNGAISKKLNLLREVDTSSDSDQTEGLDARMRSPKEKYVSEQYHRHALSLADRRYSSQLPHHMGVKVEEDFDVYNEILLEDQARESMALCSNWQHDA